MRVAWVLFYSWHPLIYMEKLYTRELVEKRKTELHDFIKAAGTTPKLVIITTDHDPASQVYVKKKKEAAESVGISCTVVNVMFGVGWRKKMIEAVDKSCQDPGVNGVMVQLPLPDRSFEPIILEKIDPSKDVDGLGSRNFGKLVLGRGHFFIPATVKGILSILEYYKVDTVGKEITILGRSEIVGRPLSIVLSQAPWNASVTVLHSKSKLSSIPKSSILISATGNREAVNFNVDCDLIIDAGIHRTQDGIKGDVKEEFVGQDTRITAVPGGVGPMTVLSLLENVVESYKIQNDD